MMEHDPHQAFTVTVSFNVAGTFATSAERTRQLLETWLRRYLSHYEDGREATTVEAFEMMLTSWARVNPRLESDDVFVYGMSELTESLTVEIMDEGRRV